MGGKLDGLVAPVQGASDRSMALLVQREAQHHDRRKNVGAGGHEGENAFQTQ